MYTSGSCPISARTASVAVPAAAARTEPREMYRLSPTATSPTTVATRPERGERMSRAPQPVAVPFPPLKPMNTGRTWPARAARAAAASTPGSSDRALASATASTAFPMSSRSTRAAAGRPMVRRTFVIPVLPLPYSLTSTRLTSQPAITPKGIDPSRYPAAINRR